MCENNFSFANGAKASTQIYQSREQDFTHTIAQLKSLLTAYKIAMIKPTVTGPPAVIDMADDVSYSDFVVSKMTGESVGQMSASNSLHTQSLE